MFALRNPRDIFPSNGIIIDINLTEAKTKFFFFGCWNDNLNATKNIIKKINDSDDFSFGIVNGDNFYPTKTKDDNGTKRKIFDMQSVEKGFNVLKNFKNPIYCALGNHEVDNLNNCETLLKELEYSKNSNINFPAGYYCLNITNGSKNNIKIFVLDTNLLENNFCYEQSDRTVESSAMTKWLSEQLIHATSNQIFIVGHYPLFYIKKSKFVINPVMKEINDIILSSQKHMYYLASDIHNYQHIVYKNINQFIIGTGGAHLDEINTLSGYMEIEKDFSIYDTKKSYGFLKIVLQNESVEMNFIDVDDVNHEELSIIPVVSGGYFNLKYIKYMNKNEKLIKNLK
jgi:hypothetical protein